MPRASGVLLELRDVVRLGRSVRGLLGGSLLCEGLPGSSLLRSHRRAHSGRRVWLLHTWTNTRRKRTGRARSTRSSRSWHTIGRSHRGTHHAGVHAWGRRTRRIRHCARGKGKALRSRRRGAWLAGSWRAHLLTGLRLRRLGHGSGERRSSGWRRRPRWLRGLLLRDSRCEVDRRRWLRWRLWPDLGLSLRLRLSLGQRLSLSQVRRLRRNWRNCRCRGRC